MRLRMPRALSLAFLAFGLLAAARAQEAPAIPALPAGQRWLQHFEEDLLPFWDMPDAFGDPSGDFPTFRCNDGHRLDPEHPCPEIAGAPGWIKGELGRDYTRMKSRQTFFYGVAYHLTGDPRMLALARDGVTWIRRNALDKASGSAVSYWEKGVPGPAELSRTSQDLAYAELGMAMYWYLTRDPGVLRDIQRLKRHIFSAYWNPRWNALRWVVKAEQPGDDERQELVAQLDQINAYLLLLTPLLPAKERKAWTGDLQRLAGTLVGQYRSPDLPLFWGTIQDEKGKALGSRHNDFGHTAKSLWMLERIGRLTGDPALVDLATADARRLLKLAYLPGSGSWGSRLQPDGTVNPSKEWWIYAELDQLSATLALRDRAFADPLPRTYDFWFRYMVDHDQHEVWGFQRDEDPQPAGGLKIHMWKSGYHSAEHALVGYLAAQALHGEPATLWFAAPPGAPLRPYVFSGRVASVRTRPLPGFPGRRAQRVAFGALR